MCVCVCVCVCACMHTALFFEFVVVVVQSLSCVSLFVTPQNAAGQALLSMGFPK